MLDPRNLTFVAVLSSNPSIPVGYTQFVRMGDDSGAKRQIASRDGVLLRIFAWVFWVYSLVLPWIVGKDRSADPDRVKAFEASHGDVDTEYWNLPERKNRWHATSVVVKQEWQGRGIGKMLMAEIVARAEEEGVVVGLEASGPGEQLYRRVGFELLGRLKDNFAGARGGVMIYTPSTLKKT
jgi:ribosomal protein S18 acetylase RimI-like enzyme